MSSQISDIVTIDASRQLNIAIEPMLSDRWLTALSTLTQHNRTTVEGHEQIISRIPIKTKAFCIGALDGEIVAIGLAVLERKHVGIHDLAIHPNYKRQGFAQSLLKRILQWGKENSAEHVYLTVQGDNVGAIKLYTKIGLKDRYHYRYLIKAN
jgi:ribosomal protein S18 acetylase RimI-like enzyme